MRAAEEVKHYFGMSYKEIHDTFSRPPIREHDGMLRYRIMLAGIIDLPRVFLIERIPRSLLRGGEVFVSRFEIQPPTPRWGA